MNIFKFLAYSIATFMVSNTSIAQSIIADNAELKVLADGFKFTEGPAADEEGNVYFSDIPAQRIYIWTVEGNLEVFQDSMRHTNGLMFGKNNELYVLDTKTGRKIVRVNVKNGEEIVLCEKYQGKKFNSPNDLWIDKQGGIYFTDPRYGNRDNMEMEIEGVYYLPKGKKDPLLVEAELTRPNGVLGTPDGKTLYIADHKEGKVFKYSIEKDGTLSDKTFFAPAHCDGMTIDEPGNIYLTTKNVEVYTPNGELLHTIETEYQPTNVCFGGADNKMLFITARKVVYGIQMEVKGVD